MKFLLEKQSFLENKLDLTEDDESGEFVDKVDELLVAAGCLKDGDVDHREDGLVVGLDLLVPRGDGAPEVGLLLPLENGPARSEARVALGGVQDGEQEINDLKS